MLEPDPDRATERLIERVHRGDHHAFEELIAIHRDRLKSSVESWAKFRLGPPVEIDEILHETSLRAFRSLGSFAPDGKDSFFRWLCGIAKRAMAQLRDERRGRPSTLTAPAMGDVPATSPLRASSSVAMSASIGSRPLSTSFRRSTARCYSSPGSKGSRRPRSGSASAGLRTRSDI